MNAPTDLIDRRRDEVLALADDLRDETISSEGLARLDELLREDISLRQLYVEYNEQHVQLTKFADSDRLRAAVTLGAEGGRSRAERARRFAAVAASAATAATLFMGFLYLTVARRPAAAVGRLASLSAEAEWADAGVEAGAAVRVGDRLILEKGSATIELTGVAVDLIAPAKLTVEADDRVRLHSGLLASRVNPAGHGFLVRTEDIDVVDLGTEFVVHKDFATGTGVGVTKGRVEARLKSRDGETTRFIELLANQRLRFDVIDETLDESAFGFGEWLGLYDRVRRARGGVIRYSGAARPLEDVADGLSLRADEVLTGGRVYVIPERTGLEIAEEMTVETSDGPVTLPAGTVIDSYLAHFDIGDGSVFIDGGRGAVSFGTPILAVVDTAAGLAATDDDFGLLAARFDPATHRGLEPDEDTATVTGDRSAVTFDVAATPGRSLDQFRVLVRAASTE